MSDFSKKEHRDGKKGVVMVKIDIDIPTSCDTCPFKGARVCYIATWLGTEYREVPEEGRAERCMMEEVEDDRNTD